MSGAKSAMAAVAAAANAWPTCVSSRQIISEVVWAGGSAAPSSLRSEAS
jgi:hypothetical protein